VGELEGIVQRMIEAGESEEAIAMVVREFPQAEPSGVMSDEAWAALPVGQKMQNVLQWGGKALASAFLPGEVGQQAAENPGTTLAGAALPAFLGGAARFAPAAGAAVSRALQNPLISGGVGALEGYRQGGIGGAVIGGGLGVSGGTHTGRFLDRVGLGQKAPKPTLPPGARLNKTPAKTSTLEDELASVLRERPPTGRDVGLSHPTGGGFTVPPKVPRAPTTPQQSMFDEIQARNIDWRTTDAVPIDAIKRDMSRGGSIIEAGESQVGLAEQLAKILKSRTPEALAEADRLARAIRQRGHITAKSH
jgi:hypothetical protein